MSAQVAADLRAAAEVLRRDGWTQGEMEGDDGVRCVLGALYSSSIADSALAAFALCGFIGGKSIADWNDVPGRTADEVIAALEAAAEWAEAAS